jgi:lipoprotein-releasing system ATP-binding protein
MGRQVSMTALLTARGITKSYRMGKVDLPVLRGIDLTVGEGEILAVTGPSGAGKSTLLHILAGLDRPDQGEVILTGKKIYGLSRRRISLLRNQGIGIIFQFFHLLPELTAGENVILPILIGEGRLFPSRSRLRKEAVRLLSLVDLRERIDHYPGQLSGGERQRVAIARALANNPRIILADEPTGNLDSRAGEKLFRLFSRLNRQMNQTILVVSHDPQVAGWSSRVVHIKDGILREGSER